MVLKNKFADRPVEGFKLEGLLLLEHNNAQLPEWFRSLMVYQPRNTYIRLSLITRHRGVVDDRTIHKTMETNKPLKPGDWVLKSPTKGIFVMSNKDVLQNYQICNLSI